MGRDELRNWVFRIVAELVGADPEELEPDDSLYDIGMQSITLMQFLEIVRNEQGSTLSYESAINAQSLGGLIDALKREGERTSASGSPETGQIEDPEDGTFPLSVMSHAYWAGRQDKSDGSGFAAHFYHEFTSQQIDPTTLAKAVDKLYARHSMLRAAIDSSGRQRVLDVPAHPGCTHHDLRNLDDKKAEEKLLEIRDELSNKAMDISRGEVLDVHLTSLPSGKSVTHILLDMGVADARSFRNILNDLAAFYNGRDAEMPAITTQYRDCLPLMFDKERENADKLWWKKRLGSMGRAPELPLAPKANTPQHRSYRLSFYLSRDELQNLASFSRKIKVTQTATLLAVFTKVVSTWSQNDHFLINVPVFSRPVSIPDIDKVVGDFTGSVILTLNGLSTTCGESCQEANELLAEALSHKEYPGVKVLRDLGRKRGETARAPIVFTSAMGIGELFSSEFRETLGRPSWIVSHSPYVWLDAQTSILDGRLHVNWDVRDGVLADGVAEAMFEAFEALLRRIASGEVGADDEMDVGLPASQASTRLERQRRADSLGISAQPEGLLHGRLLEQAAANPLALAVVDGEGGTTYADLARRAGSVAAALADAGAGPGDRVAVCMPKGALQIASVLGALMAGCCYVPIDPHLPEARKAAVLEEASPKVLLAPACEAGGWAVGAAAIDPSEVPDRPRPDVPNTRSSVRPTSSSHRAPPASPAGWSCPTGLLRTPWRTCASGLGCRPPTSPWE